MKWIALFVGMLGSSKKLAKNAAALSALCSLLEVCPQRPESTGKEQELADCIGR